MKIPSIIVDLDGTLVANQSRMATLYQMPDHSGIDWDKWNEEARFDPHAEWCLELVEAMAERGYYVLFVTGRSAFPVSQKITEDWLAAHVPPSVQWKLIMRPANDLQDDSAIKSQIFWTQIAPFYDVLFAVDDKESNCDMWRLLGITALHCADY